MRAPTRIDHADQQDHEGRGVGAHRAGAGRGDLLAGQRAGDGEDEDDRQEAGAGSSSRRRAGRRRRSRRRRRCRARWAGGSRCSRRRRSRCCWPARGRRRGSPRSPAGRPGRSTASPPGSRSPGRWSTSTASGVTRMPRETSLISLRLDLLAQVLRRSADHQPADEDGQQDVEQHRVEAGADAAEDDLAGAEARHRHGAAEAGVGVEGGVDRAVGGDGRRRRPERRLGDAVALLLAFHVAAGRAGDRVVGVPAACSAGVPCCSAGMITMTKAR